MRSVKLLILIVACFGITAICVERAESGQLMAIIFLAGFLLSVWLLVSSVVCLFWLWSPPEYFWAKHRRISTALYAGAFFGCAIIVGMGIERLLWFIPQEWVYEGQGETHSVRIGIAGIVGFIVAFFLFVVLEKPCVQKHREQTEERIASQIARFKESVERSDDAALLPQLRLDMIHLVTLQSEDKLTPIEQRALRALNSLFAELDKGEEDDNFMEAQEG